MSEQLQGGPCDGELIVLHPLSNWFELHIHQGNIVHVYRRQIPDVSFQPNPLIYIESRKTS